MSDEERVPDIDVYAISVVDKEGGSLLDRMVTIIFDDFPAAEASADDYYDTCQGPVREWLAAHFPGEFLSEENECIERVGEGLASHPDPIDMRTVQ